DDGTNVCILHSSGQINGVDISVDIKWFEADGDSPLQIWFSKGTWNIPSGANSKVSIEFDSMGPWSLGMSTHFESKQIIWFAFPDWERATAFMKEFRTGNTMKMVFSG